MDTMTATTVRGMIPTGRRMAGQAPIATMPVAVGITDGAVIIITGIVLIALQVLTMLQTHTGTIIVTRPRLL